MVVAEQRLEIPAFTITVKFDGKTAEEKKAILSYILDEDPIFF